MNERLTDEEMKAIRAFCDAGGPGPWRREQEEFITKGPRWLRLLLAEREQAPAAAKPLPMPDGIFLHNAQHDPCDMAVGPCCCGAWHNAEETLCRLRESARAEVRRLRKALHRIGAMAGNPEAADACRLIIREVKAEMEKGNG